MLGISSCDKAPINGKLDGRWQLMTIEYTNGKIEECNRIYYSIQLHLVEISAKGGNGGTHIGRFSYKGDEVTMSEFRHRGDEEKLTTLNELKPFGLNQAINHLNMHASHSESSKKIYHRLYKLSADKISAKQFIRYSSGKPLYRISRNQFIGRNKTGATTHGAGFTNIEAGFMKQVLYLPVVCGEINLSSRLDIQFYRLQHVFRT